MKHNKLLSCGLTIDQLLQKCMNPHHTDNQQVKHSMGSKELLPIRTEETPADVECRFERKAVINYVKLRTAICSRKV